VANKRDVLQTESENQSTETWQRYNLYLPMANLTTYQQVQYSGVKIFNNLPLDIKNIVWNSKKFKQVLRKFLNTHSFYTMKEFYNTRGTTLQ
jgi:hypothetical protein